MSYYADVGITILSYVMLAVSVNLLIGYAGQTTMAQAAFFGIGAFAAGRLALPLAVGGGSDVAQGGLSSGLGWNEWIAMAAAVVLSGVAAFAVSIPAARRVTGEYLILLTLAFQTIVSQLMLSLDGVTGGSVGLYGLPPLELFGTQLLEPQQAFLLILAVTAVVVVVCWCIGESPFGRVLRGIREDEVAVRALGKNTWLAKALVFGVSAAIAGGAGALLAFYHGFVSPASYTADTSIFIVSLIVLGGSGNMLGAIVGAILLAGVGPVLENVSFIGDDAIPWQGVIYGAALMVMAMARPQGLIPEGASVRRGLASLRAGGRRAAAPAPGAPAQGRSAEAALQTLDRALAGDGGEHRRGEVVLEVSGLSKRFGGVQAVSEVGFELRRGTITALIGPNGAGKTTIFNLVMGAIEPDAGRVVLKGRDVVGEPTHRIARQGMSRSFQDVRVFEQLTALDNVAMAIPGQFGESVVRLAAWPVARRHERRTRAQALDYLSFVGLEHVAGQRVANLSFGDQKLVAIARLLATQNEVLLLDEPTAGVDVGAVEKVIGVVQRLRDHGVAVCIVEHSLHVVEELADDAIFLDQGTVLARGTIAELTSRRELTEVYFGA
ncbi:branched-chain amino acid ABC transporter ATP-binding protein/permease [Conexibacter sp. CPCC 206217]|uniref:branched-chain amino acid ABC transporter ATP-binding protein/permease n=1 Tax=Conexibacter sp. CPCC 206217 TaxID=3064574 RepID=UPI00271F4D9B|nr:branched-chain amino acid ABC transporter ATP-binding protein/permease [Conexibacter sp. CPCC 206217]MDO8211032.1 branched-chain amino acid ABC transporter ATP-binding protein/permease [Conexibacter sp. CPCC 206217]